MCELVKICRSDIQIVGYSPPLSLPCAYVFDCKQRKDNLLSLCCQKSFFHLIFYLFYFATNKNVSSLQHDNKNYICPFIMTLWMDKSYSKSPIIFLSWTSKDDSIGSKLGCSHKDRCSKPTWGHLVTTHFLKHKPIYYIKMSLRTMKTTISLILQLKAGEAGKIHLAILILEY